MDTKVTAAAAPRCQVWPLLLIGLVVAIWGAYVLMTRYQGEEVGVEIIAGGPAGAVVLARALLPTPGRRGGSS